MKLSEFEGLMILLFMIDLVTYVRSDSRPNFLIMMADDLGYGDLGCYGNKTIRTPNLDQLAEEGIKLTHHLAASSVCTPSRAAFLTARYPIRSGMAETGMLRVLPFVASTGGLPPNETTFATLLKDAGYVTALIGKWHLGVNCHTSSDNCHHPLNHGFDHFYGLPLTNLKDFGDDGAGVFMSNNPRIKGGLLSAITLAGGAAYLLRARGRFSSPSLLAFLTLTTLPLALFYALVTNIKLLNSVLMRDLSVVEQPIAFESLTPRLLSDALAFLETVAPSPHNDALKAQAPFLLFFSFHQVHTALYSSPSFAGRSCHGRFGDNVEEMDWMVGVLLGKLKTLGLDHNTVVYFTSDQGGHIEEKGLDGQREGGYNGRFKGGKGQGGMEGGIRVPGLIKWPAALPSGLKIKEPTSLMDILPTVCAMAGGLNLPQDRIIDGKNILPLLQGETTISPHEFLFHYCGVDVHAVRYRPRKGTRIWKAYYTTPRWLPGTQGCHYVCFCYGKRNVRHHDPPLLFEINSDPYEDNPLPPTDPGYAPVMAAITKALEVHRGTVTRVPSQFSFRHTLWKPWLQPCCNFPLCRCTDAPSTYPNPLPPVLPPPSSETPFLDFRDTDNNEDDGIDELS